MNVIENSVIFITGGAGFIGSTLASQLIEKNKVILYDNLERNAVKSSQLLSHENINFVRGDVLSREKIEGIFKVYQPNYIVHCAAIAGVDTVIKDPVKTLDVNVMGTINILKAALSLNDLKRIILFSTSEVFGNTSFNSSEGKSAVIGAVGEARWTYALSKLTNEHYGYAFHKKYNMPTVILRPFNIYGPGQVGEGALSIFIQKAIKDEKITIHGDGSQIRAWCYIDDMVRGMLSSMINIDAIGKSFNIGNPRSTLTIYGLANAVIRILNSKSEIEFVTKTHADIELRIPDVRFAKEVMDFIALVDLEKGIPLTADYYRERIY